MENKLFFVGLKAFVLNDKKELLILQGSSQMEKPGIWGLPGGRIMESESQISLTDILLREIKEECGELEVNIYEPCATWRFENETKSIFLVGYKSEYVSGEITLKEEHVAFKWIKKEDLDNLVFIDGYKEVIVNYFNNL